MNRSGTSSRCSVLSVVLVVLLSSSIARADEPVPTTPAPAPTAKPDGMDFDLLGDDKKPAGVDLTTKTIPVDPLKFASAVKRRRLMLQIHTGLGFATLAMLAATCVVGQLDYDDKYGGNFTNRYAVAHPALAGLSSLLFATDASLALFAPTPYKKPIKADAALAHKLLMAVAAAGFITELILGPVTASKGGELNQKNLALGHIVTGYVTFASMLGGYLSYVF